MRARLLFAIACSFGTPARAQTVSDLGTWTSVTFYVAPNEGQTTGPRLWADLHARRVESGFVGIVRPGIGWDLAKGLNAAIGYAWIATDGAATDGLLSSEHRIWEQLLYQRKVGEVGLGGRIRVEQRFLADGDLGHRLRLWVRTALPLAGPLSLVLTEEVFLGLNETDTTPSGFDQNRAFVGPALPMGDIGRIELGYLNVFLDRGDADTMLHVVACNVFVVR